MKKTVYGIYAPDQCLTIGAAFWLAAIAAVPLGFVLVMLRWLFE